MKKVLAMFFVVMLLMSTQALGEGSYGIWQRRYYVDEFKEPTDEMYVTASIMGTFSNSATTDSELRVIFIVDTNHFAIQLREYDEYIVKNSYSHSQAYEIRVKDNNDEIHTLDGEILSGGDRIILNKESATELISILNEGGRVRFSIQSGEKVLSNYVFSIRDASGFKETSAPIFGRVLAYMGSVQEGVVAVIQNDMMGAINTEGNTIVPCEWDVVYSCSEGIILVYEGEYLELDGGSRTITNKDHSAVTAGGGYFGFVGIDGRVVTDCIYENAGSFSNGRAKVFKNGKWGFIDTAGNEVIPLEYDYVENFSEGYALVFNGKIKANGWPDSGTYSFVDANGNVIYTATLERARGFKNGFAMIQKNGKCGFIDTNGQAVIQPKWDDAYDFSDGLAAVKQGNKWGYIDSNGEVIIPCSINAQFVGDFSEGFAYIMNTDRYYGFVDTNGVVVIPCKWKYAESFENGFASVRDASQKYGIISSNGTLSVPCKWDEIARQGPLYRVREYTSYNKQGIGIGGKYGLMDAHGTILLPIEYDSIRYGEGYYTVSKETTWMLFDEELNRIF